MTKQLLIPGIPPGLEPKEPVEGLSPDRRRSKRQRERLAAGLHPLTGRKHRGETGATCGNCAALHARRRSGGVVYKCSLYSLSHCAATDVRRRWPGCESWKAAPGT